MSSTYFLACLPTLLFLLFLTLQTKGLGCCREGKRWLLSVPWKGSLGLTLSLGEEERLCLIALFPGQADPVSISPWVEGMYVFESGLQPSITTSFFSEPAHCFSWHLVLGLTFITSFPPVLSFHSYGNQESWLQVANCSYKQGLLKPLLTFQSHWDCSSHWDIQLWVGHIVLEQVGGRNLLGPVL